MSTRDSALGLQDGFGHVDSGARGESSGPAPLPTDHQKSWLLAQAISTQAIEKLGALR